MIFDIGRVLVDFYPEDHLRSLGMDEEAVKKLMRIVFGEDWSAYDRGDYPTMAALTAAVIKKHPADEALVRRVLRPELVRIHVLRPDVGAYLAELKARGCRVYLLSNIANESFAYVRQFPFFSLVDGGVFSFRERVCKPDARIYRILLDRFGLSPARCVMLDDNPANIATAQKLGVRGVLFTTLSEARAQTEALLQA